MLVPKPASSQSSENNIPVPHTQCLQAGVLFSSKIGWERSELSLCQGDLCHKKVEQILRVQMQTSAERFVDQSEKKHTLKLRQPQWIKGRSQLW